MIIADENLDARIISALREREEIYSIAERHSGFSDEEVIALAKNSDAIILTLDKDFGEWVFAHHVTGISVVLLRYRFSETEQIISRILSLLKDQESLRGKFTTVTTTKTRSRDIP